MVRSPWREGHGAAERQQQLFDMFDSMKREKERTFYYWETYFLRPSPFLPFPSSHGVPASLCFWFLLLSSLASFLIISVLLYRRAVLTLILQDPMTHSSGFWPAHFETGANWLVHVILEHEASLRTGSPWLRRLPLVHSPRAGWRKAVVRWYTA